MAICLVTKKGLFLSTPSARRATPYFFYFVKRFLISIHALREEGDCFIHARIQSLTISIHALREEGDTKYVSGLTDDSDFYPRPPRGGRLIQHG